MNKKSTRILLILAAFALFIVPVVALAAAGFDDVDDDNVFVADIQWMKDNGITKGCNPPANTNFCPDKVVTRQQMSAFMHRIAVNKVVDAATAVNSDKLDGKHSTAIAPIAVAQVDKTNSGVSVSVPTIVNSVSITVPTSGMLTISGSAFFHATSTGLYGITTFVNGARIGTFSAFDDFTTLNDDKDNEEWLSYTTAAAVTPGTYTVKQKLGKLPSGSGPMIPGSFFYNGNTMTVVFTPGGTVSDASTANASDGDKTNGE